MTKKCILGLLLGLAIAPAALANTISVKETANASFGGGGEFTATELPTHAILGLSRSPGTFQTFCLEPTIPLHENVKYDYVAQQTDHSGTTLKLGTAWLFNAFSTGTMSDYDYNLDAGNVSDAKLMQEAIWFFQGKPAPNSNFQVNSSNKFVQDAITALDGSTGNNANGAFGVVILNLTDANGNPAQDLLGQEPPSVPDGGTTIALLGFVLVGVESLRRRLA